MPKLAVDNEVEKIPEPTVPLGEHGLKAYKDWCRTLIQNGQLTTKTKEYAESFGISVDMMAGGKISRAASELRRSALMKLDKVDADKSVEGKQEGQNIFARFGFAKRARQKAHA